MIAELGARFVTLNSGVSSRCASCSYDFVSNGYHDYKCNLVDELNLNNTSYEFMCNECDKNKFNLDKISGLRAGDMTVIFFCSVMTACAIAFEILLCSWLAERRLDCAPKVWGRLLSLISGIRLFFVLPFLARTVGIVVVRLGVDSLSVCFNAVALLFFLEIDNVIFKVVLDDSTKVYHREIGAHTPTRKQAKEIDFWKKFLIYWSSLYILSLVSMEKLYFTLIDYDETTGYYDIYGGFLAITTLLLEKIYRWSFLQYTLSDFMRLSR